MTKLPPITVHSPSYLILISDDVLFGSLVVSSA
ncbi:hypothetical protein DO73_4633 [Burkholderia pseudomallei]|nr:hypothetical protein DO73_4633 [Burkholderia pseudomallei]